MTFYPPFERRYLSDFLRIFGLLLSEGKGKTSFTFGKKGSNFVQLENLISVKMSLGVTETLNRNLMNIHIIHLFPITHKYT